MEFLDYYEGIEFLIAMGSIMGLLGLVVSLFFFIIGGPRVRTKMIRLLITSIILISVCGIFSGTKFFHI